MIAYLKVPGSKGFETTTPFDAKESPLRWQEQGLMETADGYGRQLTTVYMVKVRNRWRRVYACQIANAGTLYIGKPGEWEYIVENIMESV